MFVAEEPRVTQIAPQVQKNKEETHKHSLSHNQHLHSLSIHQRVSKEEDDVEGLYGQEGACA